MSLTSHDVIVRPVISEKSMDESQRGKYTFAVHDDANKIQIKSAVEELFKVQVTGVNLVTVKSKAKRGGMRRSRATGWTKSWRKAIVTLAPGQKIEFFEAV